MIAFRVFIRSFSYDRRYFISHFSSGSFFRGEKVYALAYFQVVVPANQPGTEIISLTVQTSELLPFFLGRALGIWECSYGKKPKISIHFSENQTSFKIESFLDYI